MNPLVEKTSFTLFPTPGRVIVQEDEFNYSGKIIVPEAAKRRPTTGVVIAVGDGVEVCKTGDKLVYGLYSGTVINFKGQPAFRILGQDEVLAIIQGEAELQGVGTA